MPYYKKRKIISKSVSKKSFNARVRKVITAAAQTKHITGVFGVDSMDDRVMYFQSPTQNIAPGTGIGQRIGDAVKLHSLKLHGWFVASTLALSCVKWRVTVFYSAKSTAAAGVTSGAFTATELFLPNTTLVPAAGMFDEKAVQLLADTTIDLNSLLSTAQDIKSFSINVPLKDIRANYIDSGSAFVDKKNLYVMVTGYTAVGANVADLGNSYIAWDLSFKDI